MLAISNANAATSHANFAIEPETLEDWLSDWDLHHDRFPAHVGDRAGQIVGFARATPWKGRCAYEFAASTGIYVDPACHGEGLGSRMYDALLQGLRQAGFHTAIAGIALPNAASVALHERYGFEYVGTFRESGRKFGRWWDVAYYQCMLASQPSAQS